MSRGDGHQADVPTQEEIPAQDARVSYPHVDARRAPGAESTSPQGPQAPDAVSDAMNRRHRLSGRRRIAAVREAGSEARSGVIRLRAIEGDGAASRVAFAVPGAGGAIRRNRAKRRLRAAIAPLLLDWPRLDVVVSLPGSASEMPFADLRAALATALGAAAGRVRT
jgi:ribonuclease P protein component